MFKWQYGCLLFFTLFFIHSLEWDCSKTRFGRNKGKRKKEKKTKKEKKNPATKKQRENI